MIPERLFFFLIAKKKVSNVETGFVSSVIEDEAIS